MDEAHRDIIQTNYASLVKECDVDVLLPILVQKKVFSNEMIMKYINEPDKTIKKRNLFMDIQRRGPYAFGNLVAALRETNQARVANLLDPISNPTPGHKKHAVPFLLPTNTETIDIQTIQSIASYRNVDRINFSTEPIRVVVRGSMRLYDDPTRNVVPIYSTHSKKRGIALIINIINYLNEEMHPTRNGAEVDSKNLKELFLQMGFVVEAYEDLTGDEIKNRITAFKLSPQLKGVDMVFVIIMGHGYYAGEGCLMPGIDNKKVHTAWIEEQFDNVNCKVLQNRPKIMMYQTCRGNKPDHGVRHRIETDGASRILRTRTDMLIAHSTLPGNKSHRDTCQGSWYIQTFCEVMMNLAYKTHLEDVFKIVDKKLSHLQSLSQTMQTSSYTNQGFKVCYVHPKIYAEEGIIKDIYSDMPIENVT